jgi:EAL domain-containing protein (putative c-di-GMP-specific phosphodiesterase class I)
MTVTAEGIETDFHARVLSDLACDHFQGYLYGRPTPATDLAAFLMKNRQAGAESVGDVAEPARREA